MSEEVQGRLPVEENPPAGKKPGFAASWKDVDNYYRRLGKEYPLPIQSDQLHGDFEALKAEVEAIKNGTTDVSDSEAQTRLQAIEDKLNAVLSVSDSDAKTELEALKQKSQDILDKLNGTLETSVTGSYVGNTLDDAPETAEDGNDFIALETSRVYVYYNGDWREL